MAAIPAGQPGVPEPGHEPGTPPPHGRHDRLVQAALAVGAGLVALRLAHSAGVVGKGAVGELAQGLLAAVVLFGVTGFGLTRLLLPSGLRPSEPLWVLPVGACATALGLTILGYAAVPFHVSLVIVLIAGVAVGVYAVRRDGVPGRAVFTRAAWPAWIAVLICAVALIPLFRAGFATVGGQGQDAHLAVGTAIFLQRHYPTSIHTQEAVDRVPLVWGSKQAIYYALGANASLAGLEVYQTISITAAVMLAMAVCGFFILALYVLRAPYWAALVAMGLVGLNRMVLHTVMHPYFNQTWGFFAMSFAIVLCWWAVREPTRGGIALLAMFCAVVFLSYPLAFPIALIPLVFAAWERRAWFSPKRLYSSRRSLIWMIPVGFALLFPISAGFRKVESAQNVIFNPTRSLADWGGDLTGYFPEPWFFGMNYWGALIVLSPVLAYGFWLGVRNLEPVLRRALWTLLAFGIVFVALFRARDHGFYFEFKLLAFVVPIGLTIVAAGFSRLENRYLAIGPLLVLLILANTSANRELSDTFDQLPKSVLSLRTFDHELPPGKSIRLDVDPQQQNWIAFMLHGQPLCSQHPLLGTSYPHVPTSRKADYIVAPRTARRPADAVGAPVATLPDWTLYRENPAVPGVSRCSQKMVQTVTSVTV